MIHFENLWEQAEVVATQEQQSLPHIINLIKSKIDLMAIETETLKREAILGVILFELCAISQKLGLNSYTALLAEIQDRKVGQMPDE